MIGILGDCRYGWQIQNFWKRLDGGKHIRKFAYPPECTHETRISFVVSYPGLCTCDDFRRGEQVFHFHNIDYVDSAFLHCPWGNSSKWYKYVVEGNHIDCVVKCIDYEPIEEHDPDKDVSCMTIEQVQSIIERTGSFNCHVQSDTNWYEVKFKRVYPDELV